jgi:uncharacterized coiled-coil DUF342 family protein
MTGNRFILSSIACGVSFGITLGLSRGDFGQAFGHGALTFLASQIGAVVAGRQPTDEDDRQWRAEELRGHIRALQRRRTATYEELEQLTQSRDRALSSLQSLQAQLQQLQAKSNTLWQQKEALSWTLTTPTARRTTTEIQDSELRIKNMEREEAELNRSLSSTLAAKQRAELHLTTTQSELSQLQAQVAEQKVQKADILEDIMALSGQQTQLKASIEQAQAQLADLERYRKDLTQLIEAAEPARQQVTQGTQSLQSAIDQLQGQIGSLHGELETLETQILDRRSQKTVLDQELDSLRDQTRSLAKSSETGIATSHRLASASDSLSDPWQDSFPTPMHPSGDDPAATVPLDFSQYPSITAPWTDFAAKLPKYEFQALGAIAHDQNPAPQLKKIAEANLTMPELLIDAINERALEIIGDIILEPSANKGIPIIAQEYETSVRAILRMYEAVVTHG